jgi:hypothetical protein
MRREKTNIIITINNGGNCCVHEETNSAKQNSIGINILVWFLFIPDIFYSTHRQKYEVRICNHARTDTARTDIHASVKGNKISFCSRVLTLVSVCPTCNASISLVAASVLAPAILYIPEAKLFRDLNLAE